MAVRNRLADCGSGVLRHRRRTPRFQYRLWRSAMAICLVITVAGCGRSGAARTALPVQIVARIGETVITTRQLNLLTMAKAAAVATSTGAKPRVNSEPYFNLRGEMLSLLLRVAEARQECHELAVSVTKRRIGAETRRLALSLGGDERLAARGLTRAEVRLTAELRTRARSIAARVGARVSISGSQVAHYYQAHPSVYTNPSSRKLGLILVRTRMTAVRLRRQLAGGASLAQLARMYSLDRTSARIGGLLTTTSTGLTKPLAKVAFALGTGELSAPTRTAFGWAIVKALSPIHVPTRVALRRVRGEIRRRLLVSERTLLAASWFAAEAARFCKSKLEVRTGFMPSGFCASAGQP
jgi:hypothetical protein